MLRFSSPHPAQPAPGPARVSSRLWDMFTLARRSVRMKKFLPVLAAAVCVFAALPCYADCGCGAPAACGCEAAPCDTGCHTSFFSRLRGHFRHHDCCAAECAAPSCGCATSFAAPSCGCATSFAAPSCGCDTGCHHHHFRLFGGFGHHNSCDCAPPAPTCCAAPPAPCAPACGCERPRHHWFGHHHHDCGCGAPAPSCGCGY